MTPVKFFDVLGIDPHALDRAAGAKRLWPNVLASLTQGLNLSDDSTEIVGNLQQGLEFKNIRPGVDSHATFSSGPPGQIAFVADMAVQGPLATSKPFYLRALPDLGIQLVVTEKDHPAQVFFAADDRGHELIIDRLPVMIFLKQGIASALSPPPVTIGSFDPTSIDSLAYTLNDDAHPAEIDCFVRLRLTPEGDVLLEPTVPISFGPVRWMGLPAKAVYDIQLLPSPNRREYLEWTHNHVGSFFSNPLAAGALGFRSIELDFSQPPLSDLQKRLKSSTVAQTEQLELVMEDVVIPATVPLLPIPSHGTFGLRRKISDRSDISQAYSLSGVPIQLYGSTAAGGNGGSRLTLQVEKFLFRSGDPHALDPADLPQVFFDARLVYRTDTGSQLGARVTVDDEWTLTGGIVLDPASTPVKLTIADTTIGLVGLRGGYSFGRMARGIEEKHSWLLLGDLFLTSTPSFSDTSPFKIRSLTGKPLSLVLHDIGYRFGQASLAGLQMPDGMQLIFGDTVRIIVEEMGWVEEPNGTPYFSFSGGVALGFGGGNAVKPTGDSPDKQTNGLGIRVRRLRFRLVDDDSQPLFKIDGVFLKLKYKSFDVEGFGYISDYIDSGWAIREWGLGATVGFEALNRSFTLAAMFGRGSRRNIADPTQRFQYFLAALKLGWLPAGPLEFSAIRALLAYNMAPNLDATFPAGEGMALLKWHQSHDNALTMPANRTLADWIPEDEALALGIGCTFSFTSSGSAMHINAFIFGERSKGNSGLLVVGELFLLKGPKPIATLAIEYDIDTHKFGVMASVNLSLADFAGQHVPDWVAVLGELTGTLYFGNEPWALHIGQLADQSTWLSFHVDWHFLIFNRVQIAACVEIVDEGPKGFGVVFTFTGNGSVGFGKLVWWGSFGLIIGHWKTGSDTNGIEFWIRAGLRVTLFWVLSIGAEIGLRISYLGKHPWYATVHGELKFDTPWFLPDVTFTIDRTYSEPMAFDTATITQALAGGTAIDPTAMRTETLLTPGLANALGNASFVYTFNQLKGLIGVRIADPHLRDDIPAVSVDSSIAINLNQPVSNDALIASSSYDGTTDAGVQKVQGMSVRYGLKSVAVRRAPRFGPTAGVWSDFVTEAQTGFSIGGSAPQTLTFAWDVDSRADGRLAPKRLLVNSSAPYSFTTVSAQDDEESVRNDLDYPCCGDRVDSVARPRARVLEFSAIPFGSRASRTQRFSSEEHEAASWTWAITPTPSIARGPTEHPDWHIARIAPVTSLLVGSADLPDPAQSAEVDVVWDGMPGKLYLEGYDGVRLSTQEFADLHATGSTTVRIGAPSGTGISRILVRIEVDQSGTVTPGSRIGIFRVSYISFADMRRFQTISRRCRARTNPGPPGSTASGKLAFLPNHDYEIVVRSTIAVGTRDQGTRTLELAEAVYFRTRGVPGLNACANVGDDIRLHVDSTYPSRQAMPLYGDEPCALAFENSLSSVLPIDRTPATGDPPERAQMFPLELNIDRVVSHNGLKRLTVPSDDWIAKHRANPYTPPYVTAEPGFARAWVRKAHSNDPLVRRFEGVQIAAATTCGAPVVDHPSQVLAHAPIGADGTAGPWEPSTGYRATVRQRGGPFTERSGFDIYDLGALTMQADGGASPTLWSVDGSGNLVGPQSSTGRFYASCGEANWNHLQVHARIDLATATAAGIAVGVGAGTPVPRAMLAMVESDGTARALVIRERGPSGERELRRSPLAIDGPLLLTVVAYDDAVRAFVGNVSIDAPRGAVREGRVALVANGPATFAGIAVGALDIYSFDFTTSKYRSFGEHLDSYNGTLATLKSGAFGGIPSTFGSVLSKYAGLITSLMQASADPQERQRVFDAILTELGIGLHRNPTSVTITRLDDAAGPFGFLIESPEPLSVTRDVALGLTRHVPGEPPIPVQVVVLSNGAETAVAIVSQTGAPLAAGTYSLHAVLDRQRWQATTAGQPEQHYHDERTLLLQW